jgi:VWFA-related protein
MASLLPAARLLRAQAPQNSTFSTGVKVVNVLATVRNGKGELVHELTKDDFALEEDGRSQAITYFSKDTNLPLTLGLLVDTSASQRRVLDQEKNASRDFLRHILREDQDRAFLIHFEREVELLQDLTSSRSQLEDALNAMDAPRMRRPGDSSDPNGGGGGGGYPRGSGGGRNGGGTALYDAVLLASDELMAKQMGRKALIVLSDGVDNASKTSLSSAIESAQRADTVVYSIYFVDDAAYGGNQGGFGGGGGGGFGGIGGLGGGRRGAADGGLRYRRRGRMGRRSSNASPGKQAARCLRCRKSIRSTTFTTGSKQNCGASTTWAFRLIPNTVPVFATSSSRPRTRASRFRRVTGTFTAAKDYAMPNWAQVRAKKPSVMPAM